MDARELAFCILLDRDLHDSSVRWPCFHVTKTGIQIEASTHHMEHRIGHFLHTRSFKVS